MVALYFSSMIHFLISCFESYYERESESFSFISSNNDSFEWHSSILCQGIFLELTQVFSVLGFPITLIFMRLGLVVLRLDLIALSFVMLFKATFTMLLLQQICGPKIMLIPLLNFYSILIEYWQVALSEDISKKSISDWMYLCSPLWYFKTRCHLKSLIPKFEQKVWKILVSYNTI